MNKLKFKIQILEIDLIGVLFNSSQSYIVDFQFNKSGSKHISKRISWLP